MAYKELNIEERATIQAGLLNKLSQRSIARLINRSPSMSSREIRPNQRTDGQSEALMCQVPDDQISLRSYPLLAARELLQQIIQEHIHEHQAT